MNQPQYLDFAYIVAMYGMISSLRKSKVDRVGLASPGCVYLQNANLMFTAGHGRSEITQDLTSTLIHLLLRILSSGFFSVCMRWK